MQAAQRQRELIEKYSIIEDPQERLAAVVARGKKWPGVSETERTDERLVRGCVSRVWLIAEERDARWKFRVAADSSLVQGLVALLCEIYDGASAEEMEAVTPEVFSALGIERTLSATRLQGLAAVRETMRGLVAGSALR